MLFVLLMNLTSICFKTHKLICVLIKNNLLSLIIIYLCYMGKIKLSKEEIDKVKKMNIKKCNMANNETHIKK